MHVQRLHLLFMRALIAALIFAASPACAAEPRGAFPQPAATVLPPAFPRPTPQPQPTSHMPPPLADQSNCPAGHDEVWVNPRGWGEVSFVDLDVLWRVGDQV